jgi:hypothetical protein
MYMRQVAVIEPSVVCTHLMGRTAGGKQLGLPGFGISIGTFATQVRRLVGSSF